MENLKKAIFVYNNTNFRYSMGSRNIQAISSMKDTQNSNGKSTDIIAIFIEDTLEVTNEYGITNSHPTNSKTSTCIAIN